MGPRLKTSNLSRSKLYVVNSNKSESSIGSIKTSKSSCNTENKSDKLTTSAKTKNQVLLPKSGMAFQKHVMKEHTAVGQNMSASSYGTSKDLPLRQKSSNFSSRQSMSSVSKVAVPDVMVSNNNMIKSIAGGNTGARPKIPGNPKRSSIAVVKPQTNKSEMLNESSLSTESSRTSNKRKSKFVASNSFIDSEVTVRPSLPPRSLSNLSLKSPSSEANKGNLYNGHGHRSTSSKSSPFRIPRSPSRSTQQLSSRNSQPDLVMTTGKPFVLQNELVKIKLELAEKTRQHESVKTIIDHNIASFEVLAIVTRDVVNKLELSKGMNQDLKLWKSNYESLKLEMEKCKKGHQVAEEDFNKLLSNLGKDIETMCRKHEEDRSSLIEANRCKLEAQRLDFHEEKRKKTEAHEKEIALLKERHRCELNKVETQMVRSIAKEKKLSDLKEKNMSESFDDEKKKSEEKIQQLESKVSALVINLMDRPDHRDGVIGEMQKEVHSLEGVLETRNAEIKSLSGENEKLN